MKPHERLRRIAAELAHNDLARAELESIAAELEAATKPEKWSPLHDDWCCQCGTWNHQSATACRYCRRIGLVNESGKIVCSRPDANQPVIGFTPSLPVQLNGHKPQGTTTAGKISAHRR